MKKAANILEIIWITSKHVIFQAKLELWAAEKLVGLLGAKTSSCSCIH